jgi:uncharacterized membrane protein
VNNGKLNNGKWKTWVIAVTATLTAAAILGVVEVRDTARANELKIAVNHQTCTKNEQKLESIPTEIEVIKAEIGHIRDGQKRIEAAIDKIVDHLEQ